MISVSYCKQFARYNRWQNLSIYAAAATLPDGTRKRNMGAFFKSIHATLNHLLVADYLWLSRLDLEPCAVRSLDEELYGDFDELRKQRGFTDDRLDRVVATLTDDKLAGSLSYRRMSGNQDAVITPLAQVFMHLFNHQTHHRGQVTTLLMQCGVDVGRTDLAWLPADFVSPVFGT
jgi:uncharacterized damage-inducible protein DinB